MDVAAPHYWLSSRANRSFGDGCWQFTIRSADGSVEYEATDVEPGLFGQRLELLTVIRALESLDQPSRVTLVSCSDYIRNGMQYGLPEWQANGWRWECFGQMVPVKHSDLWQRLERAKVPSGRVSAPTLRPSASSLFQRNRRGRRAGMPERRTAAGGGEWRGLVILGKMWRIRTLGKGNVSWLRWGWAGNACSAQWGFGCTVRRFS